MTDNEPTDETQSAEDETQSAKNKQDHSVDEQPAGGDGTSTGAGRLASFTEGLSARRVLNLAVTLILVVVVATFVIVALPQVFGLEESLVVMSGSMEPELSPGDVVLVDGTPPENVEEGDVITFRQGSEYTTHRVIEVEREGREVAFRTAGDANENPDPDTVSEEQYLGTVEHSIPYIGHVILFTNTPHGFVLLVFLPLLAFASSQMWSLVGGTGRTNAEPDENATGKSIADGAGEQSVDGPAPVLATDSTVEHLPIDRTTEGGTAASQPTDGQASTDQASDDDVITLAPTDLSLTLVAAGILTIYSGFVGYRLLTTPGENPQILVATAMVVVASVSGLVLLGGLRALGGTSGSSTTQSSGSSDDATGQAPGAIQTVAVDSVDELASIAAARDAQVLEEPDSDRYYLLGEGTLFVADGVQADVETNGDVDANGDVPVESVTIDRSADVGEAEAPPQVVNPDPEPRADPEQNGGGADD